MEQTRPQADAAQTHAKSGLFQLMIGTAAGTHIDVEQATAKTMHR
jgi:hypothetical protein